MEFYASEHKLAKSIRIYWRIPINITYPSRKVLRARGKYSPKKTIPYRALTQQFASGPFVCSIESIVEAMADQIVCGAVGWNVVSERKQT